MKNKLIFIMLLSLTLAYSPSQATIISNVSDTSKSLILLNPEQSKAEILIVRLNVIKGLDKSNMTNAEKKALRKEVRTINTTLAKTSGGVYLSVGAILLVVLLLILLL